MKYKFIVIIILLVTVKYSKSQIEPTCNRDEFNNQHSDNQQWNKLLDKACTEINNKDYYAALKTLDEAMSLDSLVSVGGYVRNAYIENSRIRVKNYIKEANITEDTSKKNDNSGANANSQAEKKIPSDEKQVIVPDEKTQEKKSKKGIKLAYKKLFYETDDLAISVENIMVIDQQLKFKVTIINKSKYFIIYRCPESKVIYNGKDYKPESTERELIISPLKADYKDVSINTESLNKNQNPIFVLSGIYLIPAKGNMCNDTNDFVLPVVKNDFEINGFKVNLVKAVKQTEGTKLSFTVTYVGNKIGYLFATAPKLAMPDGNEYTGIKPVNAFVNPELLTFEKGNLKLMKLAWDKIPSDDKAMNMETAIMRIRWHDTFCELSPTPLSPYTVTLEKDKIK